MAEQSSSIILHLKDYRWIMQRDIFNLDTMSCLCMSTDVIWHMQHQHFIRHQAEPITWAAQRTQSARWSSEQAGRGRDVGAALWFQHLPQMYEVIHVGMWANTYICEGSGAKETSISSDRWGSEAARGMKSETGSQAGSCALQTRFSNHTVSRKTEGMFHETDISIVPILSLVHIQVLVPQQAASY